MHTPNKALAAWCLYDWANSAFTTLVVTFIYATYFTQAFAPDEVAGTALWSRAVAVSGLLVAFLSPVLGAVADRGGTRLRHLAVSTLTCVFATAVLTFVTPGHPYSVLLALTLFVIANVAFEIGMVFYNAFLPELASRDVMGRVSGYGWGLGYVGGLVCMILGLFGFVGFGGNPGWLGLPTEGGLHARATNLLVSGWFLVFSLPIFLFVKERRAAGPAIDARGAFADLKRRLYEVRRFRDAARFLLARLVYNDGLVTIFAFGGIYAAGTFGLSLSEVVLFGIVINVAAGIGAIAFGFLDDKIGGRATVFVSLAALISATLLAMAAPSEAWLWVAGITIGVFAGPNQSASRSLMGRFVPGDKEAEFFGFYAFSGKVTAFAGPFLFGAASELVGSQRGGVATVLLFFVTGGLLLLTVDEQRGIEAAGAPASS